MPERSEWLLAEGVAKRNPRYRNAHYYASERRENRLPWRLLSRLSDAFSMGAGVPGVALTLNPRLKALGLSPSAFNLSGWIPSPPPRCNKKLLLSDKSRAEIIRAGIYFVAQISAD